MSFGQPLWFWGLALLPVFIVLFLRKEGRRAKLLQQMVAARLVERLAGTLSVGRRRFRFVLLLLALAALVTCLARPRWGFTWEESKRHGRDVMIAIDCSKSMLATDVNPSRLARAKLATQDLIGQLPGDRVGLIAFAGTAFLQAPLTADYGAVLDSLGEFNTELIPRGGTNIAAAITEADAAFGKGESDNRCLILFTDGEELEEDAVAAANAEKDHMRIFTVGLGSADGSLIPIPGENGGTTFDKDESGQFVKSRLDEGRLRKIAESTEGFYVHLQSGPAEMQKILRDGLGQMKEKEIDTRMSRRPIERYEWPLTAALALLAASTVIGERKRQARRGSVRAGVRALAALLLLGLTAQAKNSGLEAYERGDYQGAMSEFSRQLQERPNSPALNFDLGAAAYESGDYDKALKAFSQAVTSPDPGLRGAAEYNLGNTLFQQGAALPPGDKERRNRAWNDALQHYEQALKVNPNNQDAGYNRDVIRKLLEEKEPPKPDQQQQQQNKKNDQNQDQQSQQQQSQGGQKNQDQQQQNSQQQQSQQQQQQSQAQNQQSQGGSGQQQQQQQQQNQQGNGQEGKDQKGQDGQQKSPKPDQGKGDEKGEAKPDSSQTGQQSNDGKTPQPTPEGGDKKQSGEIKAQNSPQPSEQQQEAAAEAEAAQEGKMTEAQAKTLLESLRNEDARVPLYKPTERKPLGRNFRDW